MSRLSKTLLCWTLVLGACTQIFSTPQPVPESDVPTPTLFPLPDVVTLTETLSSISSTVVATDPPTFTTTIAPNTPFSAIDCGYQWAYEDRPKLTTPFDLAVKKMIPNSTSRATAFGENCINSYGQVVYFLAMETDFHVTIPIELLDDYETFGNWIAQVMQIVNELPLDLIAGPKPGFVEFGFEKNIAEAIVVRVPIQQYNETANGKTGEELFRLFYTAP